MDHMVVQSSGEVMSKKMRIDLWIWVKTFEHLRIELALIWVLFPI
jgi:ribosomal 50S subunit-recycling heat shock protein